MFSYSLLDCSAASFASSNEVVSASTTLTVAKIAPVARIAQPTGLVVRKVTKPAAALLTETANASKPTAAPPAAVPDATVAAVAAASSPANPALSIAARTCASESFADAIAAAFALVENPAIASPAAFIPSSILEKPFSVDVNVPIAFSDSILVK